MNRSIKHLISVFSLATCLLFFGSTSLRATDLGSGLHHSGPHLSLPNLGAPASIDATINSNLPPALPVPILADFSGTWNAPARPDWQGTFWAVGPVPSSILNPAGVTTYHFDYLPNDIDTSPFGLGLLPTGTFLRFGDLDSGSTENEVFVLKAFHLAGASLEQIITPCWTMQLASPE